jgi:hypothetical protein
MLQINSIQPDLFSPEEVESKRRVVLFRVKKVPSCELDGNGLQDEHWVV